MKKPDKVLKEKKKRNLKNNRKRGNTYETKIAKELRELGYEQVVTSRSESKSMDDKKVDLIDPSNKLPFYPQIKKTINTPDYFGIRKACPLKDKPFLVFWAKTVPTESTFRTEGEVVFVPKEYFYELIQKAYDDK